jgi:hypothetical protein
MKKKVLGGLNWQNKNLISRKIEIKHMKIMTKRENKISLFLSIIDNTEISIWKCVGKI